MKKKNEMEIDERDFGKEARNLTIFDVIEASGTHGSLTPLPGSQTF